MLMSERLQALKHMPIVPISQETVDDFELDPVVGKIPLRARDGSIRAYAIVDADDLEWANQWTWSMLSVGYAYRMERDSGKQRMILLHRALLGLEHGDGFEGDHKDRDRLNCRRANLRIASRKGNRQNISKRPGCSSSFRGVSWSKTANKWHAYVKSDGVRHNLGFFDDEIEAADAARSARSRLLPFSVD